MDNLVAHAQRVARVAHEGQTDKSGEPYITHVERVARIAGAAAPEPIREEVQTVAWLHDAVEDSAITIQTLCQEGFPAPILDAVGAMTKRHNETLEAYFQRVRSNPIARIVKAADIDDNTSPERVMKLDKETRERLAVKYQRSRELLALH